MALASVAMKSRILFTIIFSVLALALSVGCGSACKDLAHKVCNCQPTRAKKDHCNQSIDSVAQNFDLSDEEEDRCQNILDSGRCTCEALSAGDYSACGLSADPLSVFGEST